MPTVKDLVARVGDALKQSEFRDHPDLYGMDQNLPELRRIHWSNAHCIMQSTYDAYCLPHGPELKRQDLAVYNTTKNLLQKLGEDTWLVKLKTGSKS